MIDWRLEQDRGAREGNHRLPRTRRRGCKPNNSGRNDEEHCAAEAPHDQWSEKRQVFAGGERNETQYGEANGGDHCAACTVEPESCTR